MEEQHRLALAGLDVGEGAAAGLRSFELKPAWALVAAGRRQEPDAQVHVLADAEAPLTVGLHATADVFGDGLPGGRVGGEDRVGLLTVGGGEAGFPAVYERVPAPMAAHLQANARLALRHIHDLVIEALKKRSEMLRRSRHLIYTMPQISAVKTETELVEGFEPEAALALISVGCVEAVAC